MQQSSLLSSSCCYYYYRHHNEPNNNIRMRQRIIASFVVVVVVVGISLVLAVVSERIPITKRYEIYNNNQYNNYSNSIITTKYEYNFQNNNNNTIQPSLLLSASSKSSSKSSPTGSSSSSSTETKIKNGIPSWEELNQRTVPTWYDEMKFGIFIHWGVFSVPAYRSEWFWYYWQTEHNPDYIQFVQETERPGFSYIEYATRFTAEFYNPTEWSTIFANSGAQYIVLTSKHHDGYCNWNSTSIPSTWNWNVMDVGPRRDILGELNDAIKNTISPYTNETIKFGIYHSLFEWYNLMFLSDQINNYTTQEFVLQKTIPELYDLVNRYKPDLLWSDGEWSATSDYWNSREFINWYISESPVAKTAVWNDRWGNDVRCQYGSYLTCDDRYNPNQYQPKKYENAFTIDMTTWGYSRYSNYSTYMTVQQLIHTIIQVVAFNGNVLINIGPAADGTIHPIFVDRLLGIGDWLKVNGEAIYRTKPWLICQNETVSNVFYTTNIKKGIVYVHFLKWPANSILHLDCPIGILNQTTIRFIGIDNDNNNDDEKGEEEWNNGNDSNDSNKNYRIVEWKSTNRNNNSGDDGGIDIMLPLLTPDIIPCQHAWVLAISNVANFGRPTEKGKREKGKTAE